uniref:Golgi to ER traffic protein 4 homolog n=1 Tax=Acrobeloides nanus TaxID=290746 RepID=A0A914CQG6_9BILA
MNKVDKLKKKLEYAFEEKDYYEAHQIYRTIYYRSITGEVFQELLELLFEGSMKLIEVNEYTSAIDLAELYVDTLIKSNTPVTNAVLENIYQLLSKLPSRLEADTTKDSNNVDRRNKLLNLAVKWSMQVSEKRFHRAKGHPALHFQLAKLLWSEKNWPAARTHFLLADQPEKFAEFLIDLHTGCAFQSEYDLFIAQAVLQVLCQRKVKVANVLFQSYTAKHPQIQSEPPYKSPLLNFIWLLLMAISLRNLAYFTELISKYRPTIDRDPNYIGYLDKIGQLFFGLPPPQKKDGGGLFQNLMKGLISKPGENSDGPSTNDLFSSDDDEDMSAYADADDESFMTASSSADALNQEGSTSNTPVKEPQSKRSKPEKMNVDLDLD